jgi:predicted anti-sigma-YlaC factor YlaD
VGPAGGAVAAAGGAGAGRRRSVRATALAAAALALAGCSLRKFAIDQVAAALAAPGTVWSGDDDPDLVGEALPFALKLQESLLAGSPENGALLVATCRGFVSYAAGWVEPAAERLESIDFEAARAARGRALRLHLRGRGYCLRALERALPGAARRLAIEPERALDGAGRGDVELLYWTGAAWGSAIGLGLDRPALVADLPAVRALFARALALGPGYDRGAVDEAMIAIESLSELLGGSPERARAHYRRAVELSGGRRASPHVAWALGVPVAAQDRREFRMALERALAVDADASEPDRLANRLAQERARRLLGRLDELFFAAEQEE